MRLIRLRLKHFRGVEERQVEFLRQGVTVVVGPNEIGKSSMAEALDLLINFQDSSGAREVKVVKPVDRDAGPEVEAEIETGPYAFVYRKRFLKGPETVLQITRPRFEQVTGRQAHERVEQILTETMDAALWKALRIRQGDALAQAALADASSLGRALDRAAGTVQEGQVETTLFERAKAAYDEYWTGTGRLKGDLALRTAVTQHQAALDGLESQLRSLAADVERDAALTEDRARLAAAKGPEEARVAELEAQWRRIEELARNVARLEEAEKAARVTAERAGEAVKARTQAVDELARAVAERDRLQMTITAAAPAVEAARARADRAVADLTAARQRREAAEAGAKTARGDVEYLRARRELAALTRVREDLATARKAQAEAEAVAKSNLVDDAALEAIRKADVDARLAKGLLDQARPSVVLSALQDVTLVADGTPLGMAKGGESRRSIEDRLVLEVPDTLRIEITAGTGDQSLVAQAAAAERALKAACDRVGVADLPAAETAASARREARAVWAEQKRRIADLLAGEEPDRLDARVAIAERRVAGYLESRTAATPMPADEESAEAAAEQAERGADDARTAETTAEREDRAARDQLAERDSAAREEAVRLDMADKDVAARQGSLAESRALQPDTALADALAKAAAEHETARAAAMTARGELERQGPAKTLLDNARLVLESIADQLRTLEISQAEVRARLRDHGEDGLAERRDVELSARDAAQAELERWLARAEARRKLYEALKTARDAAHLAYVGPLREKVTQLGSVVFGPGLSIEVGDDLRVRSRTLDGRTVPFESLSIGTREQLGVLTRLAGAMLVAEDGGAPVMLDDTLGFSDPRRLEAMGAVLAMAGQQCQVIVLTCYAERYRHVGGAKVIPLS